jgi:CHAT domain
MAENRALNPELNITVQNDGTVIAQIADTGEKAEDGKIDNDGLLLEVLRSFRDWLNQGKLNITLERELQVLGGLLRRLLLERGGAGVRDLVNRKLAEARIQKRHICVQLEFQEGQAELQSLPWEFLYDPGGNCFFATNANLILTRFVPRGSGIARQALSSNELPLRMQIVVSRPPDLKSVAAEPAINAIKQFVSEHPTQIVLNEKLEAVSFARLQETLGELRDKGQEPHLIHFIGHGRYNKAKRQGEVALLNDSGKAAAWVDQNQFARLFTDTNCLPRLVFLQMCEGAFVEEAELIASFEGLAPTLLKAGVQAVVAMQFPITNLHASDICKIFYGELTSGGSVGEAVQKARLRMVINSPVAAGTPVLYMFGYDGPIVSASVGTSQTMGVRNPVGEYSGGAGILTSNPEAGPATTPPVPVPTPLANPPGGAGVPSSLDDVLAAGVRKIKLMKDQGEVTEDESIELNRNLFRTMRPVLRNKSVFEMRNALSDSLELEKNQCLRKVLDEMLNVACRMP